MVKIFVVFDLEGTNTRKIFSARNLSAIILFLASKKMFSSRSSETSLSADGKTINLGSLLLTVGSSGNIRSVLIIFFFCLKFIFF